MDEPVYGIFRRFAKLSFQFDAEERRTVRNLDFLGDFKRILLMHRDNAADLGRSEIKGEMAGRIRHDTGFIVT